MQSARHDTTKGKPYMVILDTNEHHDANKCNQMSPVAMSGHVLSLVRLPLASDTPRPLDLKQGNKTRCPANCTSQSRQEPFSILRAHRPIRGVTLKHARETRPIKMASAVLLFDSFRSHSPFPWTSVWCGRYTVFFFSQPFSHPSFLCQ